MAVPPPVSRHNKPTVLSHTDATGVHHQELYRRSIPTRICRRSRMGPPTVMIWIRLTPWALRRVSARASHRTGPAGRRPSRMDIPHRTRHIRRIHTSLKAQQCPSASSSRLSRASTNCGPPAPRRPCRWADRRRSRGSPSRHSTPSYWGQRRRRKAGQQHRS